MIRPELEEAFDAAMGAAYDAHADGATLGAAGEHSRLVRQLAEEAYELGVNHGAAGRRSWVSPTVKGCRDELAMFPTVTSGRTPADHWACIDRLIAAARAEGREEMREEAAQAVEREWSESERPTSARVASLLRALPTVTK